MSETVTLERTPAGTTPGPLPSGLAWHSLLLAKRSLIKTRRNPGELLDALILPIIFLLMFGYLFGGAVAGSRQEYVQHLFPGILVMTTILVGMLATGLNINIDIKKGVFDRFRSMPINRAAPLIGSALGDVIRYVVAVVTVFAVGFLMGFRVDTNITSAMAAAGLAILLGFCLSWISVLVGVIVKTETTVTTLAFLGTFPLTFGTDMVAPRETLPGWLQAWADVNPVNHAMEASRGLLNGGPVADSLVTALLWAAGFLAVFAALAVRAYRRRI
jgi:oleandomycin transport system permease protein